MVLDARDLRPQEGLAPAKEEELGRLLRQAAQGASPREQAQAVERLRQLVLSPEGLETVWEILGGPPGDPRRLVAAQVLGYHRQWLSSPSGRRRVLEQARREADPAVGAMLVWCLRQTEEVREFLRQADPRMAREAALGVPLGRKTLAELVGALRASEPPEVERILLAKLRGLHPSLLRELVGHLLQGEWEGQAERLSALFSSLPQVPLFELFLEEGGQWHLEKGLVPAPRARNWHLFARIAEGVLQQAPALELLRHLLNRSSEDEAFARRHAGFLRLALHHADAVLGPELLKHFERLTFKASEDKLVRLAQLLVELSFRLEGQPGAQAASLLEEWKQRSPDLKLKIFHLQQRLT